MYSLQLSVFLFCTDPVWPWDVYKVNQVYWILLHASLMGISLWNVQGHLKTLYICSDLVWPWSLEYLDLEVTLTCVYLCPSDPVWPWALPTFQKLYLTLKWPSPLCNIVVQIVYVLRSPWPLCMFVPSDPVSHRHPWCIPTVSGAGLWSAACAIQTAVCWLGPCQQPWSAV